MTRDPGGIMADIERRLWKEITQVANRIAQMLERCVVDVLNENEKVVSGDLKKSVSSRVEQETNRIIIKVFTGLGYAQYVHEGTKPHYPPIFPIARWVQKKGIGQSFNTKSKRMIGTKKKAYSYNIGGQTLGRQFSKEIMSVAYAIQRSIGKKGTRAFKFFEIALKRSEGKIQQMVNEAVARIAAA